MAINKTFGLDKDGNTVLISQEEVPDEVQPPNWYGLQQSLYKSSLFTKYMNDYNTKGLIFQTTIQDGKDGRDVDESTLLIGFAAMQINFSQAEKDVINASLVANNFTIQLT